MFNSQGIQNKPILGQARRFRILLNMDTWNSISLFQTASLLFAQHPPRNYLRFYDLTHTSHLYFTII